MSSLLLAVTLVSCGSQPLSPTETAEIREIRVVPDSLESQSGRLAKFVAEALDKDGRTVPNARLEWDSADPTVAVVDTDGTVWSFKKGSVDVTAHPGKGNGSGSAPGQVKKSARVTVQETSEARPVRVADLRVESVQNSTVNLAFTEVDDGTGAPADYIVRFQISPLEWGTASTVTFGTCSGRLAGTTIGATRVCTVSSLVGGTTYGFQLIAIRGTSSDPTYGDLSNVVSATMPSPTPTSAGLPLPTQHTFTAALEDGWTDRGEGNYSHGFEGEDGYGQANYTTSLCVGCGPISVRRGFSEADEVVMKMRWKLSPNFNHNTGSHNKKILFFEASDTNPIILGVSRTERLYFATQRTAEPQDGARHIHGGSIAPGQEYEITLYVKLNSVDAQGNSNPDGIATVWIDGNRVIHATDFRFRGNDSPVSNGQIWEPQDGIDAIKWNPTWPNGGEPPSESMWERIYDIAVWSGQG